MNFAAYKKWFILGGILLFGFIILMMYRGSYNTAVNLQEGVDESWGNVQAAYQRRLDLIPNVVKTVKGAAANEKEILTKVTNARAGLVGVDNEIRSATTPQQLESAGRKINTAINLAFEAYPQVRSTELFAGLMVELEGSENRINKARTDYNETIKEYNSHIRGFFNSMFLNKEEFPKKEAFKASQGADKAPDVEL